MGLGFGHRHVAHRDALGRWPWRYGTNVRNLSHTEGDVRKHFRSGPVVQFRQQRGLQKDELLQPDGVPDNEVQFLEADLRGPRMRADGFPDDVTPLLLEPQFEQMGLQPKPFRQTREDGAERIERAGRTLGES